MDSMCYKKVVASFCAWLILIFAHTAAASDLFDNDMVTNKAVNSALKESMIAGYHGSMSKAMYYFDQGLLKPDDKEVLNFYAWFNIVNAQRTLEEALQTTLGVKNKKKLQVDLAEVKHIIAYIGDKTFGWNKTKIEQMRTFTINILTNKINDLNKSDF